ncbi:MAG: dihydroorotase [Clostridiales bacterium]|nr:dihydroorotase [Clostridiales bacterium]MDU1041881.1 dihydroorotase [Clostridiales bacterium]
MAFTLIKNGRVLDPETGFDKVADIVIENDKILAIEEDLSLEMFGDNIEEDDSSNVQFDANGCFVMPAFIDLHVHFRDPGQEEKETIRTGSRAAARGGYSTVCMMPNTKPCIDSVETITDVIDKVRNETYVKALPLAAMTANQDGDYITDVASLKANGAIAMSEDGKSVMNTRVARQAFKLAADNDMPVFDHCEDIGLRKRGVMNAGPRAKELGLYGILNAVEDTITARDIILAKDTGCHLHLCHVSTVGVVKMLDFAKKEGIHITAEVTPHHLILTDEDVDRTDSDFKMNPPLRSREDREALIKALADGTIDCIATDHAPHTEEEKSAGFKEAPFGITGLETAAPLIYTELVEKGVLTPLQMAEKMSYNPARILRFEKAGRLQVGAYADVTIFDPQAEYEIDSSKFFSKGKNTPFEGWHVKGSVRATFIDGRLVYSNHNGHEVLIEKG